MPPRDCAICIEPCCACLGKPFVTCKNQENQFLCFFCFVLYGTKLFYHINVPGGECPNVLHLKCAMQMLDTKCPSCRAELFETAPGGKSITRETVTVNAAFLLDGVAVSGEFLAQHFNGITQESLKLFHRGKCCAVFYAVFFVCQWFGLLASLGLGNNALLLISALPPFYWVVTTMNFKKKWRSAQCVHTFLLVTLFQLVLIAAVGYMLQDNERYATCLKFFAARENPKNFKFEFWKSAASEIPNVCKPDSYIMYEQTVSVYNVLRSHIDGMAKMF